MKGFQAYSIAEYGNTNVKDAAQFAACIRCCYSVLLQMKSFYTKSLFMELQLQNTFSVRHFAKKIRPSMHQPSVHCDWRSSAMTFIKNSLVGKLMKNLVVKSSVHCIIHQENSSWIKPTDALNSSFIGIMTLRVSSSFSAYHQEFLAVHRHWYILCRFDDRLLSGAGWNSKEFHPAPDSKRSSNLYKMYQCRCRAKNSWWYAERLPETCRVIIPIKLEFSVSVGFIHKDLSQCTVIRS